MSDDDQDKVDWDAMGEEEFFEKMLEVISAQPALLTHKVAEGFEKIAQRDGITRRCVLAMLTKPGAHTLESALRAREAAVAYAGLQADIRDYLKHRHDELKEWFEAVDSRILIALAQREDMDQILKEVTDKDSAHE